MKGVGGDEIEEGKKERREGGREGYVPNHNMVLGGTNLSLNSMVCC